MKRFLFLALLMLATIGFAFGQKDTTKTNKAHTVTGRVLDKSGNPVPGATVKIKGTNKVTQANANGEYRISTIAGSELQVDNIGFESTTVTVGSETSLDIQEGGGGGSFSPQSYWIGASVGYNVNQKSGNGANNIVGGASVLINPFITKENSRWFFGIIGNIGNFVSSQTGTNSNTNLSNGLSKLAQSASGLSVGVSATRVLTKSSDNINALRLFGSTVYQLNSFQLAGDTTTKSLSQWKNTIGLEFEGLQLKNGGKLHMGLAGTLGLFDKNSFQQIFMKQKSSMLSLDASIILPLSSQFGFLLEGTYSQYNTPVYLIGVIIRSSQSK